MSAKRKYHLGSTYWLEVTWKDKNGNLIIGVVAGNHEVKIYDPAGADKTGTITVNEEGNGVYSIKYLIPATGKTGEWRVKWKITYDSDVGIDEHRFEVEK